MMQAVDVAALVSDSVRPNDRRHVKSTRVHRTANARRRHKGIVNVYSKEDDAIEIDALAPASVGWKMMAAMFVVDVESELARLGISFPKGNVLVSSHPPDFHVCQVTRRGMVAIDAKVSAPTAMLMLMYARQAGVAIKQDN